MVVFLLLLIAAVLLFGSGFVRMVLGIMVLLAAGVAGLIVVGLIALAATT